jgi:hypothetical protein
MQYSTSKIQNSGKKITICDRHIQALKIKKFMNKSDTLRDNKKSHATLTETTKNLMQYSISKIQNQTSTQGKKSQYVTDRDKVPRSKKFMNKTNTHRGKVAIHRENINKTFTI